MNERLKELALEAGKYADETQPRGSYTRDGMWLYAYNEKFSQLMVKECLGACSKQAADWEGEYADAHNDGVGSCISGIKEHFGVEE